jgi:hypothetical protein
MNYVLRNFNAFFVLCFLPSLVLGQKNINIIDSLVTNIIEKEVLRNVSNISDTIVFKYSGEVPEEINYLYHIAGNLLDLNSFKVYRNYSQELSFQGIVLEISKFSIEIHYQALKRKGQVARTVNISLQGQMFQIKTGEIIRPIRKGNAYRDEITVDQIAALENSPYKFTRGSYKQYSTWETTIEPLLIVTSVAVMVFLFFMLRT